MADNRAPNGRIQGGHRQWMVAASDVPDDGDEVEEPEPRRRWRLYAAIAGAALAFTLVLWCAIWVVMTRSRVMADNERMRNVNEKLAEIKRRMPVPKAPKPPANEWHEFPDEVKVGSMTLVFKFAICDRQVMSPFGSVNPAMSSFTETVLWLPIGLRNDDPTKKIEYTSWSSQHLPTMTDDLGNSYKIIPLDPIMRAPGQIKSTVIYSDNLAGDALMFERPVPAAKTLFLTLDGAAFGSREQIRVKIDTSLLKTMKQAKAGDR